MLLVHLVLLCLDGLSLYLLIRRILADERKTAIHLSQVLGTEDKHQLILHRMMPAHIAHRSDILVLSILQLLLKGLQLRLQNTYVSVDMMDILLDSINLLLTLVYFAVQSHQVFQSLLHVCLVLAQRLLLLPDSLLNVGTLSLQSPDVGIAVGGSSSLCLRWSLGRNLHMLLAPSGRRLGSLLFSVLLSIGGNGSLLRRFLLHMMLCKRRQRERHCQYE